MGALNDLWKSERGLLAVILVIAVTVLAALDRVTFVDWQSYTMWIFGIYVGGKTASSVVATIRPSAAVDPSTPAPGAAT